MGGHRGCCRIPFFHTTCIRTTILSRPCDVTFCLIDHPPFRPASIAAVRWQPSALSRQPFRNPQEFRRVASLISEL